MAHRHPHPGHGPRHPTARALLAAELARCDPCRRTHNHQTAADTRPGGPLDDLLTTYLMSALPRWPYSTPFPAHAHRLAPPDEVHWWSHPTRTCMHLVLVHHPEGPLDTLAALHHLDQQPAHHTLKVLDDLVDALTSQEGNPG